MYYPSLEEVRRLAGEGNLVPIYREVLADLETPVSAYLKINRGSGSFLLESVEGGERLARYSFLGTEPYLTLKAPPAPQAVKDPLISVERELKKHRLVPVAGLPRFHGGAVGYLAYDAVQHFERLPSPEADPLNLPEAVFLFTDTLLVFDHLRHKIKIVSHVHLDGNVEASYKEAVDKIEELASRLRQPLNPNEPAAKPPVIEGEGRFTSNFTPEQYEAVVERAKEYIYAGDIIQVVPSQRLARRTNADPFDIYRALRTINPSPYMFYLHLDDCYIVGASPELLVRVEDGHIDYRPLAGTRRRGKDADEDQVLEQDLLGDEKERAEHVMLLDLGRNDVGRVSIPGTVRVPNAMYIVRYSHVMHIESQVLGQLRPDLSPMEALRSCFPAGTLSGAPKIRAMEIIAELEPEKRGPYGGAVGYFDFSGNLDTAIAIRTLVIKEGVAYSQAGGGIVADSVPSEEYQETLSKARATLRAIDEAEQGL